MGSGVIYAVIVALWALVLVPMWLRRHDTENEVQSVDRFSNAMGILSRREDADDEPVGHVDAAAPEPVLATDPQATARASLPLRVLKLGARSSAETPGSGSEVFVSRPRGAARDPRALRLKRRRRVLLALGLTLLTTAIAFAAGLLPIAAPLVALALSGGYGALLRRAALRDERARREAMRRSGARRVVVTDFAPPVIDLRDAPVARPAATAAPAPAQAAPTNAALATAAPAAAADSTSDRAWRPQPMPLPTYVTAPPATAVPRRLDRDADWTAQRMLERAEAERSAAGIDAAPTVDDVWSEATAPPSRDTVFDREWFETAPVEPTADSATEVDELDRIVRRGAHRTA